MFSPPERSKEMTSIRQLTRASALALVALAVAAPAAQAMPVPRSVQSDSASQTVRPPYPYAGQEFRHPTQTAVSGAVAGLTRHRMLIAGSPIVAPVSVPATPVATPVAVAAPTSGGDGFDWADAAIGALIGAGTLALVGLAGVRVRARGFAH
jgi:hypothetical protein